jgi:hypothetical protein
MADQLTEQRFQRKAILITTVCDDGSPPGTGPAAGYRRRQAHDGREANGYNLIRLPLFTLTHSNPLAVDTDFDVIDDKIEYLLHSLNPVLYPYNPRARNAIPFNLQLQTGTSGYVLPGGNSPLTIDLKNNFDIPARGTVTTELPDGVTRTPNRVPEIEAKLPVRCRNIHILRSAYTTAGHHQHRLHYAGNPRGVRAFDEPGIKDLL